MLLIGESLNVISKKIGKAFKERDPKPIQEEALFQKEKGMDYIDINLGPAKKDGHELMPLKPPSRFASRRRLSIRSCAVRNVMKK